MPTLDELFGEYHRLQRQRPPKSARAKHNRYIKRLGSEIMAHPDSFDRVRCWMVDISGKMSKLSADELEQIAAEYLAAADHPTTPEAMQKHSAVDRAGTLAQSMREFLVENGFDVTDSGMGMGEWTLGAYCTVPESRRLCYLLYQRFSKAIGLGMLRVQRLPWPVEFCPEKQ